MLLSLLRKFRHPTPPRVLELRARRRAELKVRAWDLYLRRRADSTLDNVAALCGRDWWPACGLIDLDALHVEIVDEFYPPADALPTGCHAAFMAGYFASHPGLVVPAVDRVMERLEGFWVKTWKGLEGKS